ncbi:MAG: DUF3460 family protein [Candidatus Dechloromonas phosphoritropha]
MTAAILATATRCRVWMLELQYCSALIEDGSKMGDVNTSYVSDHTKWIDEQLEKNPEWVEDQKVGRALWWDKKQDLGTAERNAASNVPQKPYPYDVNFFGE